MAKITNEITVPVRLESGDVVRITVRRPTPEESNVYLGRKSEFTQATDSKRMRSCEPEARQELFDRILLRVDDLEDDAGPVTKDTPERIPAIWKDQIIQHKIDSVYIAVDTKN